jgi:hypothetical protein
MTQVVRGILVIGILTANVAGYAHDNPNRADADQIAWGKVVNGLQLGIAPPVENNGEAVFDGSTLQARVLCRNVGNSPVRLLASVHTCLLGKGGDNALLVSELILTPKNGRESLSLTYHGWNHLSLLDERRPIGEQPQETLNRNCGGKTDVKLSVENAQRMATVLSPGDTGRVAHIHFTPGNKPRSSWRLKGGSDTVAPGTYRLTAVLHIDHELSEWRGMVRSGCLEVEISPQDEQ